jgi:hypothetical protein
MFYAAGLTMTDQSSPRAWRGRYWAMRTSPWERPYIWAEARAGRLRQGWGSAAEQNLEVIAAVVRRHGELSEEQQMPGRRAGCSRRSPMGCVSAT